eukprot:GHRQ01003604.1.p3 GENE.GHRQ01003604.1~~GHRQ01003604.1.p3  ORF type:complete len:192 (+),score=91.25 GHRQ01003604.1:1392-1967(+)
MWGCAKLGMAEHTFLSAVEDTAPKWLPRAVAPNINQVALAYGALQQHLLQQQQQQPPQVMVAVVERAQQLLSSQNNGSLGSSSVNRRSMLLLQSLSTMPAAIGWCVAIWDMQQLAGAAKALVVSGVRQSSKLSSSSACRLWVLHAWLVQHQLLDGQGLAAVLTPAQLAQCEAHSAALPASLDKEYWQSIEL